MTSITPLAGTVAVQDGPALGRMGFGAMQLPGPGVFGPPRDHDQAIAVLREAVALGVRHIDTADFYGPHVSNELIHEALSPYPGDLRIVTKVGAVRGPKGEWVHARERDDLIAQVHANLEHLGLERLDVVNLRVGGGADGHSAVPGSIAGKFTVLAELREQGLIGHLGLSCVDDDQLTEALSIAPVVTVQNFYNVADRHDDALVERCAQLGIAYAPFFPLGGFTPLQSSELEAVAADLGSSPQQTALAWLLQRSPAIAVIPGTSSLAHLRDNIAAAELTLSPQDVARLDAIGG